MLEVDDYIFDSTPDNKVCYKVTYVSEFLIEAIGYFFESRTIETKTLMLDENGNHYLPNGSIIKANEESAKALDRIIKMAGIHDPKELKKEIQEIISLSNSFCHGD